jgi:hypothetical protein
MALVARALPRPNGAEGDVLRKGRDTTPRAVPSVITTLTDRAAAANNEC